MNRRNFLMTTAAAAIAAPALAQALTAAAPEVAKLAPIAQQLTRRILACQVRDAVSTPDFVYGRASVCCGEAKVLNLAVNGVDVPRAGPDQILSWSPLSWGVIGTGVRFCVPTELAGFGRSPMILVVLAEVEFPQ
jgi:hypothetical protein